MKTNCPVLAARPMHALAPATLRITDGNQGRSEPPRAQRRAFHLTTEVARVAPDVVVGIFLSFLSY